MQNVLFYALTVLIWGSTWLAIKFQLGIVDPVVSITYRFALAAIILLLWCYIRKLKMAFTLKDHLFMALQGGLLFAINYWLFYLAELYLTSGLAAVIFSTIIVMNVVNGGIFLKTPFNSKVLVGAFFGLCGITLVFRPELAGLRLNGGFNLNDSRILGIVLCLAATVLASLGNIVSARNQRNGLPVIQTNAYGMAYGALIMLIVIFITGKPFDFVASPIYIGTLVYLSVFGSIVAFGCYLSLVGRIGADKAAYSTLLFPIVALIISTIWENYHWSGEALAGVSLILAGNLLMVKKISFKWATIRKMKVEGVDVNKSCKALS